MTVKNTFYSKSENDKLLKIAELHRRCILLLKVTKKVEAINDVRDLRTTVNRQKR